MQVVPTRKVRGKAAAAGAQAGRKQAGARGAATAAAAAPDASAALSPDDLLPRADISASITANLADRFTRCVSPSAATGRVSTISEYGLSRQ